MSDRDALAWTMWSTYGQHDIDRSRRMADRILASDWLASHDAEVRADERLRCVEAILSLRVPMRSDNTFAQTVAREVLNKAAEEIQETTP